MSIKKEKIDGQEYHTEETEAGEQLVFSFIVEAEEEEEKKDGNND